jgi:hypothetical protein
MQSWAAAFGVPSPVTWVMFHGDMRIINYLMAHWPALRLAQSASFGSLLLLVAALVTGCSHTPKNEGRSALSEVRPAPLPPLFLNGPMALLLTNTDGFHAHVVLESGLPPQALQLAAGELMGRGSKLLFAPAPPVKSKKQTGAADSAFIWDVIENRGWVLNDPLQAYAPVSSSRQFTNVAPAVAPNSAAPEKIDGHSCRPEEVTITAIDGTATVFRAWRAPDLRGLPLRITCPSTGTLLTLTLSNAKLQTMPNDLFLPPTSFTKYESSEAIMAEMFLRKHNLNRKPTYQGDESEPPTPPVTRAPTRPY